MARSPQMRQPLPNEQLEEDILNGMGLDDDVDNDILGGDDEDEDDAGDDDSGITTGSVEGDDKPQQQQNDNDELTRKYHSDKHRNLVDDKGKIVARAGKERDIFQQTRDALTAERNNHLATQNHLRTVAQAGQELLEKYKALRQTAEYYKTIGLTDAEAKEAVEVHARFKTDPKGALKYVLTKMHLGGNDLTDIGVSGPLDARAIADEAIRKFQANQPKPVKKTPEQEAQETATEFLKRFPDAVPQIGKIAKAKLAFPHLTLDQIWVQYLLHQVKKQFTTGSVAKPQQQQRRTNGTAPLKPHNANGRDPKRRGLDLTPRDHSKSFSDIGRELLADIRAIEDN